MASFRNLFYIYIFLSPLSLKSEFLVGDLSGPDVKNTVARALMERIVIAAQKRDVFRVFVVIPLHTKADFINNSSARYVMDKQYQTICR